MDGSTVRGNLKEKFLGLERLVFMADLYKGRYVQAHFEHIGAL